MRDVRHAEPKAELPLKVCVLRIVAKPLELVVADFIPLIDPLNSPVTSAPATGAPFSSTTVTSARPWRQPETTVCAETTSLETCMSTVPLPSGRGTPSTTALGVDRLPEESTASTM
jgi:hypothetical protein